MELSAAAPAVLSEFILPFFPGGVHPVICADDTTVLCTDNVAITSVPSNAGRRVQLAAAVLVHWARKSKMTAAGNQTKLLVLSQNAADDSADCATRVVGRPCAPLTSSSFWAFAYGRVPSGGARAA